MGDHAALAINFHRGPLAELEQKAHEDVTYLVRLLLLHPMPRPLNKMDAPHLGADSVAHRLECARRLEHSPVGLSPYENRGYIHRAPGEAPQLGVLLVIEQATVLVQSALKPGPAVLARVHAEFRFCQPVARRYG